MSSYKAIADFYDAENAHHPMLQNDVPFFLGHLPRTKRLRVLDVACGTGRSSIPIAQAGHRVVGIDYAKDMIDLAIAKRDSIGLKPRDLELIYADALKFKLADRFDWACIFFNTFLNFTTLAQQDKLLQNIQAHLRPRGRLWLDVFHPDPQRLSGPVQTNVDPSLFFVDSLGQSVYRTADIKPNPAKQIQHITFRYSWHDEQGDERHAKLEFDLTWIVPREMQLLLERNGFIIEAMYGNYDGSTLKDESPRMIVHARRTK